MNIKNNRNCKITINDEEKDLKDLQSKHNNSIEIEYVDADGGGITYISTKEQLKELINFASYKDGYEVLNIK